MGRRPWKTQQRPAQWRRKSLEAGTAYVRKNEVLDVFDVPRWRSRHRSGNWSRLTDLTGLTNEKEARRLCVKVMRAMVTLAMEDLLDGCYLILPEREFGYLYVGNVRKERAYAHYPWDIEIDGAVYNGIVVLDKRITRQRAGVRYQWSLPFRARQKIRELRTTGKVNYG